MKSRNVHAIFYRIFALSFVLISLPLSAQTGRTLAEKAVALYSGLRGSEVDELEAFHLFERAAELGDVKAEMWRVLRRHIEYRDFHAGDPGVPPSQYAKETQALAAKAIAHLKPLLSAGDPEAQFLLAHANDSGLGAGSILAAINLYQKSCPKFALSCEKLGRIYMDGKSVQRDDARAVHFFQQACDAGVVRGCQDLALMTLRGRAVSKDERKAHDLLAANCKRGFGRSCYDFGILYRDGVGAPKNRQKAVEYYAHGCLAGCDHSCNQMNAELGSARWQFLLVQDAITGNNAYGIFRPDKQELYWWLSLALANGEGGPIADDLMKYLEADVPAVKKAEINSQIRGWQPARLSWDPDHRAWEIATKKNTEASYLQYKLSFPQGKHVDSAEARANTKLYDRTSPCPPTSQYVRNAKSSSGKSLTTLQFTDLRLGAGAVAETGDVAEVEWTARLADGTLLWASQNNGRIRSEVELGSGKSLAGLENGILAMRVGGRRKLTVPSHLAYGKSGSRCEIPPDATLILEVELLNLFLVEDEEWMDDDY